MRVTVVGAGFGGLAAAALLARNGFDVTVLEQHSQPGGRARVYTEKGFTFDMGPSWYLMPDVFERYFQEFDATPSDYYQLTRVDPSYRIFFHDGTVTDVSASLERNLVLFDRLEPDGGEKLREYLARAKRHYALAMDELIYRDYRGLSDLLSGKLLLAGLRIPLFGNVDDYVSRVFTSEKAKRILEYSIGFIGGSPRNTPALYYIMNHVDFNLGVWYPQRGIGAVVDAYERLAVEHGAEIRYDTPVTRLNVDDHGKVTTVSTSRGEYGADVVVVNADYPYAELQLLDARHRSYDADYWEQRILAPSAFVVYLGLDRKLDLQHHNLFLQEDWERGFDVLFDPATREWPDRPSYYVNVTSKTDETVAPEGGETVFVLVPLPPGVPDTPERRERYYDRVIGHLEDQTGAAIRGHEVVKRIFALNDFQTDYNAYKGTALGLTHTLRQTALFRPAHRSRKVRNLYYTGHYTHPGIGMPMVTISSQILSREITKQYREDHA